jgi:hypothetical protein
MNMTTKHDATAWYGDRFAKWQGDHLGRKPTSGELATIHALGARPGKQALANAMALRPAGVTGGQIVIACGAPQLNKMRGFITDGLVKRVPMSPVDGHTVYRIELTAKGQHKVKAADAAAAKADAKGAADAATKPAKAPRKPKAAKPASEPAVPADAAPVSEPATPAVQGEANQQPA